MSKSIVFTTPLSGLEQREEQASATNPTLTWMDFIFTDDQPNDNGVGVRADQFSSIEKTGILMPLKVAEGAIAPGHKDARPLGVISELATKRNEEKQFNFIAGKAALWAEERPEDVTQIKEAFAAGDKLNISWELLYSEEDVDDNGIRWLLDPVVRAATIVGVPAYSGRTPVLAVASAETEEVSEFLSEAAVWTTAYINDLPDSAFLYIEKGGSKDADGKTTPRSLRHFPYKNADGQIDLPHLRNALSRIPQSSLPEDVKKRLAAKAQRLLSGQKSEGSSTEDNVDSEELTLEEATAKIQQLTEQLATVTAELEGLRAFKADADRKEAEAALLQTRLAAFTEAGIAFTPEEVAAKQSAWLKLDEDAFKFLVSELKGLKVASASGAEGDKNPPVPEPVGTTHGAGKLTAENLKEALTKQGKK